MRAHEPPASIFFLAYAQCDELDVVGPYAVLQTANRYLSQRTPPAPTIDLRIVAVDGAGAVELHGPTGPQFVVTGIHGMTLGVQPWDGTTLPDVLIVAGGNTEPGTGVMQQKDNTAFTTPIGRQFERGALVVSVCTGAFALVGAGVAQGRLMTTHPGLVNDLAACGVEVVNPDWTTGPRASSRTRGSCRAAASPRGSTKRSTWSKHAGRTIRS
ncbi:MAG TPA: DJ-1/PfpI family protein [Candidatus Sulfotelmatobacter sp.]|nr:DJ-1/PfpI family protein [Candidatus Sulfotelmatobacter sp.]